MCTNAAECVVELQTEGSERNLVGHRKDGHSGQVGDRITSVPFTGGSVEAQTTICRDI